MFAKLVISAVAAAAPTQAMKMYAAGSGQGMLGLTDTCKEIVELSNVSNPNVLYLGTATYDDIGAEEVQTRGFVELGCEVTALRVTVADPNPVEVREIFDKTDIVVVSGGNTLFAYDRWVKLGITDLMNEAMQRDVVMAGGSAGAIVWFDGGHSDSMDSKSYKNPPGPLLHPELTPDESDIWAYIRTPALSYVPGLLCPHYDSTQSNGVLRATDMINMLRRHSGERAIGVDNWAAVVIDGDNYRIVSREGQTGSVGPDGVFSPGEGFPGVWSLELDTTTGEQVRTLVPQQGRVATLVRPARFIVEDSMLGVARAQNPDDGMPPTKSKYFPSWAEPL